MEFYRNHGFAPVQETEAGVLWRLDLHEKQLVAPAWIRMTG
jgi:hypothetical protein